jgi:3-oxoadipate enol-lactonase
MVVMPFAEVYGGTIHYRIDGNPDAHVLVLSHSLGADHSMWDRQVAAFAPSFQVLRYDSRGHGLSLVTPGPYSIELLARDFVSLLDRLGLARVCFCGLSLGGMIGMWLGRHEPARVDRLVLANTSAYLGPPALWDTRMEAVRRGGMSAVAGAVIERWFTAAFRERSAAEAEAVRQTILATPPEGYLGCCAAVRDTDQRADLGSIRSPTLVVAGRDDPATPPEAGRAIAGAIPGARIVELPAAHLSNIEAAAAFDAAVLDFLLA